MYLLQKYSILDVVKSFKINLREEDRVLQVSLKKWLTFSVVALGLGVGGTTVVQQNLNLQQPVHASVAMDKKMVSVDNESDTRYTNARNTYWRNRVNAFANVRKPYYHPEITYNTRALDRLPTYNYKHAIRPGMLYRSANLHWINRRGANSIKRLNIKHDIDLRAPKGPNVSIQATPQPSETKHMPDKYGIHMNYHNYPVENSWEEKITWPYRKRFGEAYRFSYWYALSDNARKEYHNAITYMLAPHKGAIMYNCTQGRDRTGTLSVIIEKILGVSNYNIYNDFLLTNHYKYQSNYVQQLDRINTFYHAIYSKYGTWYRYERYGLNLRPYQLRNFRKKYLMPIHVNF